MSAVSGHVFRYEGNRRPVWRAKYRLPDGRQVQKTIGPAWTARGRPPAGYFTKRTAEAWLRRTLAEAATGTLPGLVRAGATVADVCAEYLHYIEHDRLRKPSTLRDYGSIFRNHVLRISARSRTTREIDPDGHLVNRTREKTITVFHGVMERARKRYRLPTNPVADIEKPRTSLRTEIHVFSPEEVMALLRAADSEQDAAIYLTAAFTGLRQGEVIALRWPDVDFAGSAIRVRASYTNGHLTSPKSGKVRSVPMAVRVAETLARLSQREYVTHEDDLVFCASSAATSTARRSRSATAPRSNEPHCELSASTTSATRSERGSSASPTSAASRNGGATRTSRRRAPAGRRARRQGLRVIAESADA
jgi:integrase